jgi:hypothetical protein
MATYAITFRIGNVTVNGKTYDERRAALVDSARTEGMGYWDETTSFFMVESLKSTDALGRAVSASLSAKHDMVVVFDPADMSACYFGAVKYEEVLRSFFAKPIKLG